MALTILLSPVGWVKIIEGFSDPISKCHLFDFFFFFSPLSPPGVHQVRLPQQTVWKRPTATNVFPGNAHSLRLGHIAILIVRSSDLSGKIITILSFPTVLYSEGVGRFKKKTNKPMLCRAFLWHASVLHVCLVLLEIG